MNTQILEKIGLTKNEIIIYLSLLELGTTTTGPLAKHSKLHTSRIYESLNKLIEKGLVSFVINSNIKNYSAADPSMLLAILEEQKKEVDDLIPKLKQLTKETQEEEKAAFYQGYKGVRYVFDSIIQDLKKGDEILVLGARKEQESFMSKTYLKEYTKRRVANGIKMKMLFNENAKETGKYFAKIKNTQVRYTSKNMKTPSAINIFGNKVGTLLLSPTPRMFIISSKQVADSYREFFKMLWNMGE